MQTATKTKKEVVAYIAFKGRLWQANGTITTREEFNDDFGRVVPKGWFLTKSHRQVPAQPQAFREFRKTLKGGLSLYRKIYRRALPKNRQEVRHY